MTAVPTAASPDPIADDAPHILVVDDDQRIRDLLARYLVQNGYRVTTAPDVANARASMRGLAFDLILLDWMMPGESGIDLARELTGRSDVPVCMLTARTDPDERVMGLEAGVEDFIHKPFEPRELLLRLRNILRRGQAANGCCEEIRMGAFVFHITRGELKRGDDSIKLTERERELLRQFAGKQGQPIPRYELSSDDSTGSERAIDVQINRLRRKIETDPSNPVYLQTVRGKGYILYVD
ncbi:MAG: two-component system response regulator [Alphaproteobacteria bacterium BRH_c36]|nr:MAG: two-component system response regulator [Alphaproteobacteria bacterium BRH_c36]